MSEIILNTKKIILEKGLKQKYIAEKMGITEQKMSDILNERKVVDDSVILSLCNALDVSPNELFGYSKWRDFIETYRKGRWGCVWKTNLVLYSWLHYINYNCHCSIDSGSIFCLQSKHCGNSCYVNRETKRVVAAETIISLAFDMAKSFQNILCKVRLLSK